jgi:hypothetical protein
MGKRRNLLFAIRCTMCDNEFVYCLRSGKDFRCYSCKQNKVTVEDIQKELSEMPKEEYQSFMEDIKEYEDELEKKRKEGLAGEKDSQRTIRTDRKKLRKG